MSGTIAGLDPLVDTGNTYWFPWSTTHGKTLAVDTAIMGDASFGDGQGVETITSTGVIVEREINVKQAVEVEMRLQGDTSTGSWRFFLTNPAIFTFGKNSFDISLDSAELTITDSNGNGVIDSDDDFSEWSITSSY